MTTVQKDKVARRKLSLLQLAQEMGNVSKACRVLGYSRQQFYEIRRNYQTFGAEGLIDGLPGAKGPHPNRVPKETEDAILAHALDHPTHGAQRVSDELRLRGIEVSAGGVRGVWARHQLQTKHERLLRLEETVSGRSSSRPSRAGCWSTTVPSSGSDTSRPGTRETRWPWTRSTPGA